MKPFLISGNWKLNKGPKEAASFIQKFSKKIGSTSSDVEFVIFPPAMAIETFSKLENEKLKFGLQNIFSKPSGAYTGENSAEVLKVMGGSYVLIGHSERRALFGESLSDTSSKMKEALRVGLVPILCVGESLEERESGKVFQVLKEQISAALDGWDQSSLFHIAYEPVWAIGTGKVATEVEVKEAHAWIRKFLDELKSDYDFSKTQILYGGSVKSTNATNLSKVPEVGGFLIGGASLDAQSLWDVYEAVFSQ